jgi:hypothetical protein
MRTVSEAVSLGCCAFLFIAFVSTAGGEEKKMTKPEIAACLKKFKVDPKGDKPMRAPTATAHCKPQIKANGLPVPDPKCTPGAINPTMTLSVLTAPDFRTECIRDQATSAEKKKQLYGRYDITEPPNNEHDSQVCELDHFISLELGGADTLDNLWPQCGPDGVELQERFFKQKDIVENFLAHMVKQGKMTLGAAQAGIAADWTQFLEEGKRTCPDGKCPK